MIPKLAITALPEMLQILQANGIDTGRVTDASVKHSPKGGVTEITVTMLALAPDEEQTP